MEKIKLNVEGMHCPSCEMLISDSLKEIDGVKTAVVNHKSGVVEVAFDQTKAGKIDIIETIKKEGYKVRK